MNIDCTCGLQVLVCLVIWFVECLGTLMFTIGFVGVYLLVEFMSTSDMVYSFVTCMGGGSPDSLHRSMHKLAKRQASLTARGVQG